MPFRRRHIHPTETAQAMQPDLFSAMAECGTTGTVTGTVTADNTTPGITDHTATSTAERTADQQTVYLPSQTAGNEVPPPLKEELERLFSRLARSDFRSRFRLRAAECSYIERQGLATIRHHAEEFVRTRLAPAFPHNDGHQTPMRGHPVFIAQHATGCCCRGCLAKWHGIPAGRPLSASEQQYVVQMLMAWIERQMAR